MRFRSISVDWIAAGWWSFTGGNSDARAVNVPDAACGPWQLLGWQLPGRARTETQWRRKRRGKSSREIDSGVLAGRCWIYNSVRHPPQHATCRHPLGLDRARINCPRTFSVGSKAVRRLVFIALTRLQPVPSMVQWIWILELRRYARRVMRDCLIMHDWTFARRVMLIRDPSVRVFEYLIFEILQFLFVASVI